MRVMDVFFCVLFCKSLRAATPLEEMSLSWTHRIGALDKHLARTMPNLAERFVKPYEDVDKEDHFTSEHVKAKYEKTKEIEATTAKK